MEGPSVQLRPMLSARLHFHGVEASVHLLTAAEVPSVDFTAVEEDFGEVGVREVIASTS